MTAILVLALVLGLLIVTGVLLLIVSLDEAEQERQP